MSPGQRAAGGLQASDWLRLGQGLWSRFMLRRCTEVGLAPEVLGEVWVRAGGTVRVGDRVRFDASRAPIELSARPGAEIRIGSDVCIEGGTSIEAHDTISIGDGTHIEGFCKLVDLQFQPIAGRRAMRPTTRAIVVGQNVVLGLRSIVLPGATVLARTVVPPGSVLGGA